MFKKSTIILIVVLTVTIALFNCSKKNNNNPVAPPTPTWQTVFFDNFNRADTANGDLGPNWTITSISNTLRITNNEVCAEQTGPSASPMAFYIQPVNNSVIRVSAKIRTGAGATSPLICLLARATTNASTGYGAGLNGMNQFGVGLTGGSSTGKLTGYTLSANTTYILEFTLNNSILTGTLQDSSLNTLITLTTTNNTFVSGKVGFIASTGNGMNVYIDDFKIEKYE